MLTMESTHYSSYFYRQHISAVRIVLLVWIKIKILFVLPMKHAIIKNSFVDTHDETQKFTKP